jgi:hypothetical protein
MIECDKSFSGDTASYTLKRGSDGTTVYQSFETAFAIETEMSYRDRLSKIEPSLKVRFDRDERWSVPLSVPGFAFKRRDPTRKTLHTE